MGTYQITLGILHMNCGSCNGCDIEILAALIPRLDAERFGVLLKGTPRHADVLVCTGPVTTQMKERLKRVYDQMPEPKFVVAVGQCGSSGGIYKGSYAVEGGIDTVTGTSTGVPVLNCDCAVCRSDDPRDRRLRPSVLLEWDGASVLVDTATDLREQGFRQGLARVDAVLYTHAHADHVFGLDDLRLFNWRQRASIPAYGSAVTLPDLKRTFWYVFEDVEAGGGKPAIDLVEVDGPFELLGRRVVPIPL